MDKPQVDYSPFIAQMNFRQDARLSDNLSSRAVFWKKADRLWRWGACWPWKRVFVAALVVIAAASQSIAFTRVEGRKLNAHRQYEPRVHFGGSGEVRVYGIEYVRQPDQ